MKFLFIAMNNMGELTGGDRIWINFQKYLRENSNYIDILLTPKTIEILDSVYQPLKPTIINILWNTFSKTIAGTIGIKTFRLKEFDYVYSVSDFYPDLIPALIYKLRHKQCKWIAGYFLIAPNPLSNNSPYKGINWFKGFLYWLMQRLSLYLVRKYADIVFITSEPDRKWFPNKKVVVIRGGVDTQDTYNSSGNQKIYHAVFVGRFHYQKGVIGLIDIWKKVIDQIPEARLVMIGDGPLYSDVINMIKKNKLEHNIHCVGFKDGAEKIKFFKQAKLFLHPATYDSGGMAAAEAMVWGLPCVGFDLEAYRTYYPKGMVKVKTNQEFSDKIGLMLRDKWLYDKYSQEARELIMNEWDWEKQARRIYNEIK